jgi:hypothetical protein
LSAAEANGIDDKSVVAALLFIVSPEFFLFLLFSEEVTQTSRHSMKPHGSTPTYVGIVRVHFAYSNQQILKIPNCVKYRTDI